MQSGYERDSVHAVGNPTIGSRAGTINQQWVRFGATAPSALHRFYAISDVLTITRTPIQGNTRENIKAQYR